MERVNQAKEAMPGRERLDPQALELVYRLLWRDAKKDERNKEHGSGIFIVNSTGFITSSADDGDTVYQDFERKERRSPCCAGIVGHERRTD